MVYGANAGSVLWDAFWMRLRCVRIEPGTGSKPSALAESMPQTACFPAFFLSWVEVHMVLKSGHSTQDWTAANPAGHLRATFEYWLLCINVCLCLLVCICIYCFWVWLWLAWVREWYGSAFTVRADLYLQRYFTPIVVSVGFASNFLRLYLILAVENNRFWHPSALSYNHAGRYYTTKYVAFFSSRGCQHPLLHHDAAQIR